jgi:hypothetical protein
MPRFSMPCSRRLRIRRCREKESSSSSLRLCTGRVRLAEREHMFGREAGARRYCCRQIGSVLQYGLRARKKIRVPLRGGRKGCGTHFQRGLSIGCYFPPMHKRNGFLIFVTEGPGASDLNRLSFNGIYASEERLRGRVQEMIEGFIHEGRSLAVIPEGPYCTPFA